MNNVNKISTVNTDVPMTTGGHGAMTTGSGTAGGGNIIGDISSKMAKSGSSIAFALIIVCIVFALILPMPSWLLDTLLAVSITWAVLILMTVLFIEKSLEFSSFPSILLITTMFRLSLNLSSTRLILSGGHQSTASAGKVIEAFGSFIMGGNYVIGTIVFSILVLVNFIVITKGSGRIAEVSARFTLDAMPGKQMAIDADLSSGLINEDEARSRRKELEDENTFFGAMDGASKFVRGDAIAGLLITVINVVAGILIGVTQQDLSVAQAAQTYTLLTVGDGLVSQFPALIISTASGMLITKSSISGSSDKAIISQFGAYPSAFGLSSFLMVAMALMPGTPKFPFIFLAIILGSTAYYITKNQEKEATPEEQKMMEEAAQKAEVASQDEPISSVLKIDQVRLELGYGLRSLADSDTEGKLPDQIKNLRRQFAEEIGFVMPSVRLQDNLQLSAHSYLIRIKEIEAGRGDLMPGMLLIMDPRGEKINLPGEMTKEPTFGLPAMWVSETLQEEAIFRGYTVVTPASVLITHMTELVRENLSELLTYSTTQALLEEIDPVYKKLMEDIVPAQISIGGIQKILQNLLAERVSIRDLPTILEGISEGCSFSKDINIITEHVRSRLSRQISESATNASGFIPLLTLSPDWEREFLSVISVDGQGQNASIAPSTLQKFIASMRQSFEQQASTGESPVLLTSPTIRPYVRSIIERFRPHTTVLSQNEIHPKARIKTLGQI